MAIGRTLPLLVAVVLFSASAAALSFNELGVRPGNQLYLDDSFTVWASFNGNSCDWKIRFYMDGKPFNLTGLYNGSKPLKCGISEVETTPWDLTKQPLSPGAHVLRIELIEPLNTVYQDSTQIVRVFDLKKPKDTTTTTKALPTTRATSSRATTMPTTTTTLPVQYVDYESSEYGFALSYPSTWDVQEGASGTVVAFFAPEDGGILPDIFLENFSVSVVKTDEQLDSFVQSVKDSFSKRKNVKVTGYREVDASGESGRQLNLEHTEGPFVFRAQRLYFKRNDFIYVLAYDAEDEQYSKYLPIFNSMRDSFAITVAVTTTTTTTTTSSTSTTEPPSLIPKVDVSFAVVVAFAVVALVIVFAGRKWSKGAKKPSPPQPLRPPQPVRGAQPPEERLKSEVIRKTATVVPEEKPQIEEVEDPAIERLKKIKALEKEVDEVVKKERFRKATDGRPKKPPED